MKERTLQELLNIPSLHELIRAFDKNQGVSSFVTDTEENILLADFSLEVCKKFHHLNSESVKNCCKRRGKICSVGRQSPRHSFLSPSGLSYAFICPMGIAYASKALTINGRYLGNVIIGQFLPDPPDYDYFVKQAEQYGFDSAEYMAAIRKVPVLNDARLDEILNLLHGIIRLFLEQAISSTVINDASETTIETSLLQDVHESGEVFGVVFDNAPVALLITDNNSVVIECNNKFASVFGSRIDDYIGMNLLCRLDESILKNTLLEVMSGNSVHHYEGMYKSIVSGKSLYLSITSQRANSNYIVTIVEDITRRKQVESYLQSTTRSMTALIECMGDWVWDVDLEGRYTYCSPQVEAVLGYTPEEVLGKHPFQFMPLEEAARVEQTFIEIAEFRERILNLENWNIAKDGRRVLLSTTAIPMFDEDGNLTGYRGVDKDVTDIYMKHEIARAQLHLTQYAQWHDTDELLNEALNIVERLTDSKMAMLYLIDEEDSKFCLQNFSISAQNMLSDTSIVPCKEMSVAADWFDSIRLGKPLIHNKHASFPHRKLFEESGMSVRRELVFPLLRGFMTLAVVMLGGKSSDYLEKDIETVAVIADMAWEIAERKAKSQELKDSEERYRAIVNAINGFMYICSRDFRIQFLSDRLMHKIGRNATGELCYKALYNNETVCEWCRCHDVWNGNAINWEMSDPADGRCYEVHNSPVLNTDGTVYRQTVLLDVTDSRLIKEQLEQSQKMESVGRLAGGIAHDFNNKLMVILGNAKLIDMGLDKSLPEREYLSEIVRAAEQSRDITRKLLTFSRQQTVQPVSVSVRKATEESIKSLSRLIGSNVKIQFESDENLWNIRIDPTQFDQIVMNLAVNAAYAMTEGGTLAIEASNVTVDGTTHQEFSELAAGDYIKLVFSDTGEGMDDNTLKRIFEPYFTTKPMGKGTGLGLATIYGIVSQNSGKITVESKPGSGTRFTICFPRYKQPMEDEKVRISSGVDGTGSILLVDDEPALLNVTARALESMGYEVHKALHPGAALKIINDDKVNIELVLTDVVMPEMNGKRMVELIRVKQPDMKVIFVSGHIGDNAILGELPDGDLFLQKPYNYDELSELIKAVLEP